MHNVYTNGILVYHNIIYLAVHFYQTMEGFSLDILYLLLLLEQVLNGSG